MGEQIDPEELAGLLRKPEGEKGIKIAEMLNNSNIHITDFTYQWVNPKAKQIILEIGFGNGKLMPRLLAQASGLKLVGIDFSEDMVNQGQQILKPWIDKGVIELKKASVEKIPATDNYFDSVCSINTLYFWPNPHDNAKEVLRVLKPGGMVFLGIRPKEEAKKVPATQFGFQLYEKDEIIYLLQQAGFQEVCIQSQIDPPIKINDKIMTFGSWVVIGKK